MLLHNLQPASFRGAPFLVPSDDAEEGRNSIWHEYPDASHRYIEDNGKIPPCFHIRAVLHGDNLPGKLSRLRSALNRPGPGVLKHPYYGTQFVSVDQTYRVKREDRQAGVIELDIKFAVTGPPALPGLVSGIAALVTGLASSAVTAAFGAFTEQCRAPRSPNSATVLAEALQDVTSVLEASFGQATSAPARLYDRAEAFVRNIDTAQSLLVSSFREPFEDETILNRSLVKGFKDVAEAAAGVSAEASVAAVNTLDRSERQASKAAIGMFCEFAAFCCLADAMAGRNYLTGDEVDADEQLLTEIYDTVQARGLPSEQHAQMADIYTAASEVLQNAAVRLPRLTEIDAQNTPASVLAYELYERDGMVNGIIPDRIQQIVDLNLNQDPCLLTGSTTVLTRVA